uniref:Uncharacterized protein n=1 Tax=Cereibacter sphaeroides (strain ATCC 17025 / ATH 2.4.3) TaxID=349102 RepID=A4WR07_CERS5
MIVLDDRGLLADPTLEGLLVARADHPARRQVRFDFASRFPSIVIGIRRHREERALRVPAEVDVNSEARKGQPSPASRRRNLRQSIQPFPPRNHRMLRLSRGRLAKIWPIEVFLHHELQRAGLRVTHSAAWDMQSKDLPREARQVFLFAR